MRTIRVWVELELVEGEHFNPTAKELTDEQALLMAERNFVTNFEELGDLLEYVQSEIIYPTELGCGCKETEHANTVEAMKIAHPDLLLPDDLIVGQHWHG